MSLFRRFSSLFRSLSRTEEEASGQALVFEADSPAVGRDGVTVEAIGIETLGGVFTVLIPRGVVVPHEITEIFSTASDDQTSMEISLYRGQEGRVSTHHYLGVCRIAGIAPAPRGRPALAVTFSVTADHAIVVSVRDEATGRPMRIIRITGKAKSR